MRADRQTKAWRLAQLGWTEKEIGEVLGVKQPTVSELIGNSEIGKIDKSLGKLWNDVAVAEWAHRMAIPRTDAMAAAMVGRSRKSLKG